MVLLNDDGIINNGSRDNNNDTRLAIIITAASEKFELWTREDSRLEIPLEKVVLESTSLNAANYKLKLLPGSYVLFRRLRNDNNGLQYYIDLPKETETLAPITYDGKAILIPVHFMPTGKFLYPTTAREKNLRMAFTANLGNIPIVFKNDYQPYFFYSGQAQITLFPTPVEQRLEATYGTPWLIVKDVNQLTSNLIIQEELRHSTVRGTVLLISEQFLRVYSDAIGKLTYISIQNKELPEPFVVGDFVDFVNIVIDEDGKQKNVGVLPKKVIRDGSTNARREPLLLKSEASNDDEIVLPVPSLPSSSGGQCSKQPSPAGNEPTIVKEEKTRETIDVDQLANGRKATVFTSSSQTAAAAFGGASTSTTVAATATFNNTLPKKPKKSRVRHVVGSDLVGIVAAQTVEAYYVYSPSFVRDVYLSKAIHDFTELDRTLNVGQWIRFRAEILPPLRTLVVSFTFIEPLLLTMPSFNTIMIECRIDIPADYDRVRYNNTVTSEFIPQVGDQDTLIQPCHHGKKLVATLRRTKTSIPGVYWSIEYIKF